MLLKFYLAFYEYDMEYKVIDRWILSAKQFNGNEMWGLSTCVDLYNCNHKKFADEIEKYVIELCDLIDMRRFGECKVVHFCDDPKVEGFSMTKGSKHLFSHFANKTMSAYLDIFSCSDQRVVEAFSKEFLVLSLFR